MLFYVISFSVFLIDQCVKYFIQHQMSANQSIPLIKNILHITYVQNKGAAFGIFWGYSPFLIIVGAFVICAIFYFHFKIKSNNLLQVPLALLFGGSIGNIFDRILDSYVTDYIDFRFWPVFNFADIMINLGIFLLVLYVLFDRRSNNASNTV